MSVTDRERFLSMLYTAHRDRADAIAVLMGEDGASRVDMGAGLFKRGAAPLLWLSGGVHEPPMRIGAYAGFEALVSLGVAPDRVVVDISSMHTRDQALRLAEAASAHQWGRVILVASHYHLPRAVLTCHKALEERGLADKVRLMPAAPPTPWSVPLPGFELSRSDRIADEKQKVDDYTTHVSSYAEGIAYLSHWERAA